MPVSTSNIRVHLTIFLIFIISVSFAQKKRCGLVEFNQKEKSTILLKEHEHSFEKWLLKKQSLRTSGRTKSGPYKIPVVVHIIHNGEPVGEGTNLSDEQVRSQIKVLNADFQRKNADAVNTPAEFAAVAGAMDIEFVLAKRDPEGLSTTGIERVQGTQSEWVLNDQYTFKSLSYWPSEDYLNIWVLRITDYIGYAQFPESDLPGLEGSSNNPYTDGVIIAYETFGSKDDGDFFLDPYYNKGRTTTHEVSHFLGLRHIWGDVNNCDGTDYVEDTPNQNNSTSGCPSHPVSECTPSQKIMFQNFTDYTDDACMNLFTVQQVERMQTVLENSPRRKSLLTSLGLQPPDPVANDMGLREIESPGSTQCGNLISPRVEVKNYGNNTITSASLRLLVDGVPVDFIDVNLSLDPLDSTTITFNDFTLNTGTSTLTFEILETNGVIDGDAIGNENVLSSTVYIPANTSLPFVQNFSNLTLDWSIQNPDQQRTWTVTILPEQGINDHVLYLPFIEYDNIGELDVLYSPIFDLSTATSALLSFDVSHARYDASNDMLRVVVITDCSELMEGQTIYEKSGADLATVSSTKAFFVPNSPDDWRTEIISLDAFTGAGSGYVQLAFIGINNFGNNLYLDNIAVSTQLNDISLKRITNPAAVTCAGSEVGLRVQNMGTNTINNLEVQYSINGGSPDAVMFNDLNILPGKEGQLSLSSVNMTEGENVLSVALNTPNGAVDQNPSNNIQQMKVIVNSAEDKIPLRQTFDSSFENDWTIVNPGYGMDWETTDTNYDESLYYNAFNNPNAGDESWLVSPTLDFSNAPSASMIFDLSYKRGFRQENLKILVSENCGQTYKELDYTLAEAESSIDEWQPEEDEDWLNDQYVDLTEFAGKPDIRVAFVVTNANGNNLYLDNIEFFVSKDPREIVIENAYSIFGYELENLATSDLKIGFNLEERQDVDCQITDTMGKLIAHIRWTDVLNQVYDLPFNNQQSAGAYIVRVNIGGQYSSKLVYLVR